MKSVHYPKLRRTFFYTPWFRSREGWLVNRTFAALDVRSFQGWFHRHGWRVRWRNSAKDGEYKPRSKTIWLRVRLRGDPVELTGVLLHEMCHRGAPDHGLRWRTSMKQLRSRGAPLSRVDLKILDEPYRGLREEVREQIANALADRADDYQALFRWIARDHQVSVARFRREAPWFRREWLAALRRI
jgi:hypothetical protein